MKFLVSYEHRGNNFSEITNMEFEYHERPSFTNPVLIEAILKNSAKFRTSGILANNIISVEEMAP